VGTNECHTRFGCTDDETCVELRDFVYDDAQSRSLARLRNMLPGADCLTARNASRQTNRREVNVYDKKTLKVTSRLAVLVDRGGYCIRATAL
jgi:hypothetical protein